MSNFFTLYHNSYHLSHLYSCQKMALDNFICQEPYIKWRTADFYFFLADVFFGAGLRALGALRRNT